MSISDQLMWNYYLLLLDKTEAEIGLMQQDVRTEKLHPMNLKKEMAYNIIRKFWSDDDAKMAQEKFEALFQKKDYSKATEIELSEDTQNPIWIVDLLKTLNAVKTSSDAKRLLESGAVSIDGEAVKDFKAEVYWTPGQVIKVGKHKIFKLK